MNVTGPVPVPNTGSWKTFQWVGVGGVSLTAGQHILKLVADQQYFNLDTIQISPWIRNSDRPNSHAQPRSWHGPA